MNGWERHYDAPEHLGMDLRQVADNTDARVGYPTMDAQIIRRAAACFDGLSEEASHEDARLALIAKDKK